MQVAQVPENTESRIPSTENLQLNVLSAGHQGTHKVTYKLHPYKLNDDSWIMRFNKTDSLHFVHCMYRPVIFLHLLGEKEASYECQIQFSIFYICIANLYCLSEMAIDEVESSQDIQETH